jgi:hypothetical protein
MKIKWTKTKKDKVIGCFDSYKAIASKQNHGGWAYELRFEKSYANLILAKQGQSAPYIESLHAAKLLINKKINFFYAQQHN